MSFRPPQPETFDPPHASDGGSFFRPLSEVVNDIAPALREGVERLSPMQKAWIQFLSVHEWRWFVTCTYKDPIHPEAADKQFRLWTRRIDEMHGVQQRKPREHAQRCIWVRGLEWQKRNVLHYHALVGNVPAFSGQLQRELAALEWLTISGGFARIENVYSNDVIAYVAKYTAKGGEVDFSPNLQLPDLLAGASSAA